MKWIFEITLFICVVGVIDTLFCMLIPSGNIEKSVRLILALVLSVFIGTKIIGIKSGEFRFEAYNEINSEKGNEYSKGVLDGFIDVLGRKIEKSLDEKGESKTGSRVVIIADIDENYKIDIKRINAYTTLEKNEAVKIIGECVGIENEKIFIFKG